MIPKSPDAQVARWRALMASSSTGDRAEALVAYRRCRDLVSVVLGLKPSAETERLYRDIAAGVPPAATA
jgi:DNA-binding SARP family transcriptional activator